MRTLALVSSLSCFMGLATVASIAMGGCSNGAVAVPEEAVSVTSSTLIVNARAFGDVWVAVQITRGDGTLVFDRVLATRAGTTEAYRLSLPPGHYDVSADELDDVPARTLLGKAHGTVSIDAGAPVLVKLALAEDAAGISLTSDAAPRIDGVDVSLDAQGRVNLLARVSDPDGESLTVFWGSAAATDVVVEGRSLTIESANAAVMSPTAHLVVQDAAGATASATVVFAPQAGCMLCADPQIVTEALPVVDEVCSMHHDRCIAECDMAGTVRGKESHDCASSCAAILTLCRTSP